MKLLLVIIIVLIFQSSIYASVQVFPMRIVMNDKKRTTTVSIRNTTNESQVYTLKPAFYRMSSDGSLELLTSSAKKSERSLVSNIRFSPKRIKLAPKEEQVVRVLIKKTGSLVSGDYRAHLRILPQNSTEKGRPGAATTMKIFSRVAVSIPIFYYKGKVDIKAQISNLKFVTKNKNEYYFAGNLINTGKNFLVGEFEIFLRKGKKKKLIGNISGISSYVKKRSMEYRILNLNKRPEKGSVLEIHFKKSKDNGGQIITRSSIKI